MRLMIPRSSGSIIYSSYHRALRRAADEYGLRPFEVRILYAIMEAGGTFDHHEIQEALREPEGTQIRRASVELRKAGLVEVHEPNQEGVLQKPGQVVTLRLTRAGEKVAWKVDDYAEQIRFEGQGR